MKKYFENLMYVAFLGLVTLTTSCNSDDSNGATPYEIGENHIVLSGEDNMRDLGGYVGKDGKRILYNKLFRSGELSALTDTDLQYIATKQIKQLIDLRTQQERIEKTDKVIEGAIRYELSLFDEQYFSNSFGVSESEIFAKILSGEVKAEEIMFPAYAIDETKITQWTKIFDLLESGQTTLWHCTSGKDRVGMTTALVLSSLGVDRQVIIDDFMLSNKYLAEYNQHTISYINSKYGAGVGEQLMPILGVEKEYITTFFNSIETTYGSVDNFLKVIKVDVSKMRSQYLEK